MKRKYPKKTFFKITIISILLLLSSSILSHEAHSYSLGLSSTDFSFPELSRDSVYTKSLLISTDNKNDIIVKFSIEGIPEKWINIPQQEIISAGNPKKITIFIVIPENTPLREYSGKLIISSKEEKGDEQKGSVGITPGIIKEFILRIGEIQKNTCSVKKFSIKEENKRLKVYATIKNHENRLLHPILTISLKQNKATEIEHINLDQIESYATKETSNIWKAQLDPGYYSALVSIPLCDYEEEHYFSYQLERTLGPIGEFVELVVPEHIEKGKPIPVIASFLNNGNVQKTVQFIGRAVFEGNTSIGFVSEKISISPGNTTQFEILVPVSQSGSYSIEGKFYYDEFETIERGVNVEVLTVSDAVQTKRISFPTIMSLLVLAIILFLAILIIKKQTYAKQRKQKGGAS